MQINELSFFDVFIKITQTKVSQTFEEAFQKLLSLQKAFESFKRVKFMQSFWEKDNEKLSKNFKSFQLCKAQTSQIFAITSLMNPPEA